MSEAEVPLVAQPEPRIVSEGSRVVDLNATRTEMRSRKEEGATAP